MPRLSIVGLLTIIYWCLLIVSVWMALDPMWEARMYLYTYRACQRVALAVGRAGLWAENEYRLTLGA